MTLRHREGSTPFKTQWEWSGEDVPAGWSALRLLGNNRRARGKGQKEGGAAGCPRPWWRRDPKLSAPERWARKPLVNPNGGRDLKQADSCPDQKHCAKQRCSLHPTSAMPGTQGPGPCRTAGAVVRCGLSPAVQILLASRGLAVLLSKEGPVRGLPLWMTHQSRGPAAVSTVQAAWKRCHMPSTRLPVRRPTNLTVRRQVRPEASACALASPRVTSSPVNSKQTLCPWAHLPSTTTAAITF